MKQHSTAVDRAVPKIPDSESDEATSPALRMVAPYTAMALASGWSVSSHIRPEPADTSSDTGVALFPLGPPSYTSQAATTEGQDETLNCPFRLKFV